MLDFSLSDEQNMVRNSVRAFVDKEIISLKTQVLRNEREGRPALEPGQLRDLQLTAKKRGLLGHHHSERVRRRRIRIDHKLAHQY